MRTYTVTEPTTRHGCFWVSYGENLLYGNGHTTREAAQVEVDKLNSAEVAKAIKMDRQGLRFEQISETHVECHSRSGNIYRLTGVPIPDEFDSAMRCGISENDAFVAQIPLLWSCDCPAGRHNRDCKHVREFIKIRNGE